MNQAPLLRNPLLRWRLGAATVLILLFALLAFVRPLQEPSLGWRFEAAPGAQGTARPVGGTQPPLTGVQALSAGGERVELDALVLVESAGILNLYSEQREFFARHAALWRILQAPQVAVEHAGGIATVAPRPHQLRELGLRFWFPWAVALLSMSVGLALWAYRPGDAGVRWYMLASLGYAFGMLCTAGWGARLLTQPPWLWPQLHVLSHAGSFLLIGGLCMLLWSHPAPLGLRWFPPVLLAWTAAALAAETWELVPAITMAFRFPIVCVNLALLALFLLQWRASAADPVRRAQLKWLGLLLCMALPAVFVAYAFGAVGHVVDVPQNYGLASVALVFLGLVPLVARVGLFELDRWWALAWLWFLGGLLVVLLDLAFLALLRLDGANALALALALGGWAWFPLRQALWQRLSRGGLPGTRELLPAVLELVTSGAAEPARLNARWQALWEQVFQPQQLRPADHAGAPAIADQGQLLRIAGPAGLPGVELRLPERGRRLFNRSDLDRAGEIARLVQHGLAAQQSYQRGAREERQRIASDLHDDLGAKLLTIAQLSPHAQDRGRLAELARQAMEDMRLALRGLRAEPAPAPDVLADWRSETVTRLDAAGFAVRWEGAEPPAGLVLPARAHVQLTRVLREAVTNVIRHSGGRQCRIEVQMTHEEIALEVEDDGIGLAAGSQDNGGMGLAGSAQRVRQLGGTHALGPGALGGLRLAVRVPLWPGEGAAAAQSGSAQ